VPSGQLRDRNGSQPVGAMLISKALIHLECPWCEIDLARDETLEQLPHRYRLNHRGFAARAQAPPRTMSLAAHAARISNCPMDSLGSLAVTPVFSASCAHYDVEDTSPALVNPALNSVPARRSHDTWVTEFLDSDRFLDGLDPARRPDMHFDQDFYSGR